MRTRFCLWYVACYLTLTGFALLITPDTALKLMLSNADYGLVMPRWVGMLSVALGALVGQAVRHRLVVLYPLGFFMPAAMLVGFVGLYVQSANPLFLAILAVVGIGVVATGISLILERRSAK